MDIVVALISGVTSAMVTQVLVWAVESWRGDKTAGQLALKASAAFERYAAACMELILDNLNSEAENLSYEKMRVSMPDLKGIDLADENWRFVKRELAARVFSFPDAISFAGGAVFDEFRYGNEPTAWTVANDQCAKLGHRAVLLAKALRDEHEQHDVAPEWDYRDRLALKAKEIEAKEVAWRADLSPIKYAR